MKFITGVLLGIAIALGSPAGAANTPGQGDYQPGEPPSEALQPGECSDAVTSGTYTVTNKRGQTRIVTKTVRPCGDGYSLVTKYRSPWVTQ